MAYKPGSTLPSPVRPVRRKKRVSLSPLMRATIQEYGIYDKQLDVLKNNVQALFSFLDQAPVERKRMESDRLAMQRQLESFQGSYKYAANSHVSYEEELQNQVERLEFIAKTFKGMYLKERELNLRSISRCEELRDDCMKLVTEMMSHFGKQTGILQHRLLEMDSQLEELESDKTGLKRAYENMVTRAAAMVEGLEAELIQANLNCQELQDQLKALAEENTTLKQENNNILDRAVGVESCVAGLDERLTEQEKKLENSEAARQNFETLLDIALSKLSLYEEDENRLTKLWKKMLKEKMYNCESVTDEKDTQTSCVSEAVLKSRSLPYSGKNRLDSMSITSYETATSDMSLAMPTDPLLSDDRSLSASLKSLIQKGSPKSTPRKKKRRHPFRNFLKRSISQDSQIQNIGGDRLPPIHDVPIEPQVQNVKLNQEEKPELESRSVTPCSSLGESVFVEHASCAGIGSRSQGLEKYCPEAPHKVQERVKWFEEHSQVKDDLDIRSRPDLKKVKRTASFGGVKSPRTGLMAFAKDIEKRFKRKRRFKTTDFSDIANAQALSACNITSVADV